MPNFRMVVLGDSVPWGQGLQPPQKFYSLVQVAVSGSDDPESRVVLAHSGATIGVGVTATADPIDGEVPTSYPTIVQQCDSFTDSPETVDLVLVNGGINDIDFRVILNPFTDSSHLRDMIWQYCLRDMGTLLDSVTSKFIKPGARIVVTSYFPLLSSESVAPLIELFLAMHGVSITPFIDILGDSLLDKIFFNSDLFYRRSNRMFQKAVNRINQAAGGAPRVFFAQPPFTASNAALAPEAWLWGVNADLSPQDPVRDARRAACDIFETDLIRRLTCQRASAGHPNIVGAEKFAQAILAVLS